MPTVTFAVHARFHFAASSAMKLHAYLAAAPAAITFDARTQIEGFSLIPAAPTSLTLGATSPATLTLTPSVPV